MQEVVFISVLEAKASRARGHAGPEALKNDKNYLG